MLPVVLMFNYIYENFLGNYIREFLQDSLCLIINIALFDQVFFVII